MRSIYIPEPRKGDGSKEEHNNTRALKYAAGLFIVVSAMLLFGLTMLYSSSCTTAGSTFFVKQLTWAGIGIAGAVAIFLVGYKKISEYSLIWIAIVILLLLVADFCFRPVNGAYRWIHVPGIGNIQPSEYAKIAVALFLAKYCSERMRYLNSFSPTRGLFPAIVVAGIVMVLILKGKDLGTTFLIGVVTGLVFFAAGVRLIFLLGPFLVIVPTGFIFIKKFDPERWSRMTSFLNPELSQKTDGYQLWNSLLALGSGGWCGMGFMESRLKAKYLPEAHTDFILSIVGEELGYVVLCLIILAYVLVLYFGMKISIMSDNKLGMLLGFGITATMTLQAIINIGVVSGTFPTKGMPAPFISYGGSNLVTCLLGAGLLMSIALDTAYPGLNREIIADVKSRLSKLAPSKWF